MKNMFSKKKIAIYLLVLIALTIGSFAIYKIARANASNAIISEIAMTTIKTGTNIDGAGEDNLSITCDNNGQNCTNTYTASKDSSEDNILVKSFDTIRYTFRYNVVNSNDSNIDVDDVNVKLKVTLNGDDNKYITFDEGQCDKNGVCIISGNSSIEPTIYTVTLKVNNAPNGYEIHPSFDFDVVENEDDTPITLGYKNNGYFYSYNGNTYSNIGPSNYMPTIVSSTQSSMSIDLYPTTPDFPTQSAFWNGIDGRFVTYLVGIKLNGNVSGSYYDESDISFKATFSHDGTVALETNPEWIRFYNEEEVDTIRPINYSIPYTLSNAKNSIQEPGTLNVAGSANTYTVTLSDYKVLLDGPTYNADSSAVSNKYVATLALSAFSPRDADRDGNNDINNQLILTTTNGQQIATSTIKNSASQTGNISQYSDSDIDYLASSLFYDEDGGELSAKALGPGSVSKGTTVQYVTRFKNNKTSSGAGLKEVIKVDTNAYRVMQYGRREDVNIEVKCSGCNVSKEDFEVKFVSDSFDNSNYELITGVNPRLSTADKAVANTCQSLNLASLSNDQIQNLYGGPCIKGKTEETFDKIDDAYKTTGDVNNEVPIGKIVVQTKEGVVIPDGTEVIVRVKLRVRNVSDLTHNYQVTTTMSTSDYDESLVYFAPQINDAVSPNNYIKTFYAGDTAVISTNYYGDSLRIVNYTLRQNISVTNKNSDSTSKNKFKTTDNETITYKIETKINDYNEEVGADDTWYIRKLYTIVYIPNTLVYIPDESVDIPDEILYTNNGLYLKYDIVSPGDAMKPNMVLKDIYVKTRLVPTLTGSANRIDVLSHPEAININGEVDTTIWPGRDASCTIYGTGVSEIISTQGIGTSGTLIEKNGTADYVLNAYNNTGSAVNNYSLIDILPYNNDENGSKFSGTYSVKITSNTIGLGNIKCTKAEPTSITRDDDAIWSSCGNIGDEYIEGITGIKIENVSINANSNMGEVIVSLKTIDNKPNDKYNNRFVGYTDIYDDNISNRIDVSVLNRTISGSVFVDSTNKGIKNGNEVYIKDIPITLYKVTNDGDLDEVATTVTDENGRYVFGSLSKGRYKVRAKYDISKYDLALRYATQDTACDSDAYQIDDEGLVEISGKGEATTGIALYPPNNNVTNMDIGLLYKQTFGFTMNKYITKIDLSYNGLTNTLNYNNESKVLINVKNSLKATAKVYYGISITNSSTKPGFINLVEEDIPEGFVFDKDYPENEGWFEVEGRLGNRSLENTVVYPNETVYLQIVLFMPQRENAGTFINNASVVEITEYKPVEINENEYVNSDKYVIGDRVIYGDVSFHVINATPSGNEQILTLLADDTDLIGQHLASTSDVYKWSKSAINGYINDVWLYENNIPSSALIPFNICDDASGLFNTNASGGQVEPSKCASNMYTKSKVRLLTQSEFTNLVNNLTNNSFLLTNNFWLMDSVYASKTNDTYDVYGNLNANYDVSNLVKYVNASNSSVLPVQGNNGFSKNVNATTGLSVRPVIRISTHDIMPE